MSDIIENNIHRTIQAKSEDGKFYVKTLFHDDESLNQNDRIRSSGILEKGKLGLHENEDIRFTFSVPDVMQWNLFKKNHSDVYALLQSKIETERMSGAKRLQILKPQWCVYSRA